MSDGREIALGVCMAAGQVLLMRRDGPPWPGRWSLPGGKREDGEGLADTCRRELREELGVAVVVTGLRLLVSQWGEPVAAAAGGHWLFSVFSCQLDPAAPLPANCRWFPTAAALGEARLLPADRAFLRDAAQTERLGRFRRSRVRWDGPEPELVAYG